MPSVQEVVNLSLTDPSIFAALNPSVIEAMIAEVERDYRNRKGHVLYNDVIILVTAHRLFWEMYAQGLLTAQQIKSVLSSVTVGPISKAYGGKIDNKQASGLKQDLNSTTWGARAQDKLDRMPPAMRTAL